jgi:hypothetical protein
VGENNSARVVHDGAQPAAIKRRCHIRRRAPLAAVTGNDKPRVGHRTAQLGQLFGKSRADDRTDRTVSALTFAAASEGLDFGCYHLKQSTAIGGHVLE